MEDVLDLLVACQKVDRATQALEFRPLSATTEIMFMTCMSPDGSQRYPHTEHSSQSKSIVAASQSVFYLVIGVLFWKMKSFWKLHQFDWCFTQHKAPIDTLSQKKRLKCLPQIKAQGSVTMNSKQFSSSGSSKPQIVDHQHGHTFVRYVQDVLKTEDQNIKSTSQAANNEATNGFLPITPTR
ncbi:hypothetical protein IV203_030281 [Nitzschia inconspicua]|uniref:Uncharacterized protein n=1 Tax=Nitzschia inconspicua TaxID=303405 RepID=A0A9K3LS87_9STRA|nr:hypothetical protein IV203_030281 [Nitzschia inconspicua]